MIQTIALFAYPVALILAMLIWSYTPGFCRFLFILILFIIFCGGIHLLSSMATSDIQSQSAQLDAQLFAQEAQPEQAHKIVVDYLDCKESASHRDACAASTPVLRWAYAHRKALEDIKESWGLRPCYLDLPRSGDSLDWGLSEIPSFLACLAYRALQTSDLHALEKKYSDQLGLQVTVKVLSEDKKNVTSYDVDLKQWFAVTLKGWVRDGDTLYVNCVLNVAETKKLVGERREGDTYYDCFWFTKGSNIFSAKSRGTKYKENTLLDIDGIDIARGGYNFWQK